MPPRAIDRPVLAVDVDGVISLFGFDEPLSEAPGDVVLVDGIAHCISRAAGERLVRLSQHYDLIWATGWEERANEHLPLLLGLPGELPYLTFGGNAQFGTAHWKLDAIQAYAGDRPLAWIDDNLDESCHAWAASRTAPTLLVETDPTRGPRGGARGRARRLDRGRLRRRASARRRGVRLNRVEGFLPIFFLGVVLKIPVFGALYLDLLGRSRRARARRGRATTATTASAAGAASRSVPAGPRRGPHAPDAQPLPDCPPGGRLRDVRRPVPATTASGGERH